MDCFINGSFFIAKFYLEVFYIKGKKNSTLINDQIKEKEIRAIGEDGNMIGLILTQEALDMATSKDLDLVMISPTAVPPVCRIMDYGKHLFEQSKKDKEVRKKQKTITMKEVRLSPAIEEHDFNFKLKNAIKFLKEGDKVKVSIKFRGREMAHTSIGTTVLNRFADATEEIGTIEKKPKLEGRSMTMIITPKQ